MKAPVSLIESLLLFLPLCWAICVFSTAMRRYDMAEVLRSGTRFFIGMTAVVVVGCAALYFLMEFILSR